MNELGNTCKPPQFFHHIAGRLDHFIVAVGRNSYSDIADHVPWTYNLYTEEWRKYMMPKSQPVPSNLSAACGAVIGKELYIYACYNVGPDLWMLAQDANGDFTWNVVNVNPESQEPSPRGNASAWEYEGKMWIFAGYVGYVQPQKGYLNDYGDFEAPSTNQLLQFNIETKVWSNVKCLGDVPKPCSCHATTVRGDQVWLFGEKNGLRAFEEFYQLDMSTFTWTMIVTGHLKPQAPVFLQSECCNRQPYCTAWRQCAYIRLCMFT